ncbi:hypothetical protein [Pedobacter immunditicola]|uniref:hypothetical protein n=1 Tax=Pedobacter immunditicola TaxID=3133440 RepID=UPI0030A6274C
MDTKKITFCYRKIIDKSSIHTFDRLIFEDSYKEFKIQAQNFNKEKACNTFDELIRHVPTAQNLHLLVLAAVLNYINDLNETIPDVLNTLGEHFMTFKNYSFEIISSSLHDISTHKVAITFFSEPFIWHETIDNYLLVSDSRANSAEVYTHLLELKPFLSIHSLKIV